MATARSNPTDGPKHKPVSRPPIGAPCCFAATLGGERVTVTGVVTNHTRKGDTVVTPDTEWREPLLKENIRGATVVVPLSALELT